MYPNRETYAQPPLVLVVCEVRYTDAPRLRQMETLDAVAIALEGLFPFSEPLSGMNLVPAGPGLPPQAEPRQGVLLRNAVGSASLTITPASFSYETTAHPGFEAVQSTVSVACRALTGQGVRPALIRVGLRYIDEIRVPEPPADIRGWRRWVHAGLLDALSITPGSVAARGVQGAMSFDLGSRNGLTVRYGTFASGTTPVPQHLRRRAVEDGPFFALDFDGYRDFGGEAVGPASPPTVLEALDAAVVADVLAAVHAPAGAAFQAAITEEARSLFRGEPAGNGDGKARRPGRPGGGETDTLRR